jgi:hypothetical protein
LGMDIDKIIGMQNDDGECSFCILAEIGRGETKYWPAIKDGKEVGPTAFPGDFNAYMAAKVERTRETVRVSVSGNACAAEMAIIAALGCKALACGPNTVDIYPTQKSRRFANG